MRLLLPMPLRTKTACGRHYRCLLYTSLIYGMGHAVYSLSDPREVVFKGYVEQLAHEKGRDKDLALYNKIEHMAPQLIAEERKIFKGVSPNVDFYSGFVYDMLGIPMELYTPLFAVARVMGWSCLLYTSIMTVTTAMMITFRVSFFIKDQMLPFDVIDVYKRQIWFSLIRIALPAPSPMPLARRSVLVTKLSLIHI